MERFNRLLDWLIVKMQTPYGGFAIVAAVIGGLIVGMLFMAVTGASGPLLLACVVGIATFAIYATAPFANPTDDDWDDDWDD